MKKWTPKEYERFWYVDKNGMSRTDFFDLFNPDHIHLVSNGNCFRTQKEADDVVGLLNKKAVAVFIPDNCKYVDTKYEDDHCIVRFEPNPPNPPQPEQAAIHIYTITEHGEPDDSRRYWYLPGGGRYFYLSDIDGDDTPKWRYV
jgi:hypothetical protein